MADDTQRLIVSLEARIDQFQKSLDKATGIANTRTKQIEKRFTDANSNLARGMSNVGKTALATSNANSRLIAGMSQGAKTLDGVAEASSHVSTQAQAAFHAVRSMAEGFALGMPPTQILAQQMNHLSYAASGPGGIKAAFQGVLQIFSGLFTPIRLLATGLAGIGIAGAAAGIKFAENQSKIDLALTGIGKSAGVTVDDINRIADAVSSAGSLSETEASDVATAIAATGKVSADATAKATGLAHAYSLVFNKDIAKSADDLASALADPAKGIDTLNSRLGAWSDKEVQLAKSLARQNNLAGAQKIITDGLQKSIGDAASKTTTWSHAWDSLANAASNAFSRVGKTVDQLAGDVSPQDALQAALKASVAARSSGGGSSVLGSGVSSDVDKLDGKLRSLTAQLTREANEAKIAAENTDSIKFGDMVREIDPTLSKLQALEDQLAFINARLAKSDVSDATKTAGQNAAAQLTSQIALEKQYISLAQQRFGITSDLLGASISQNAIDLQAINARTPAEKAEITFLQTRKQLLDQGQSSDAATAGANLDRTKALLSSYHDLAEAARDRIYSSQQTVDQGAVENQTIGRSVEVATRLTQQFQLLAAAKQEAFKNGTQVSSQEQLDALIKADELARQAVENAKKATITSAQFDISQLGRSQSEQNVFSTLQGAGLLDNGKIVSAQAQQTAEVLRTKEALTELADVEKGFASDFLHDLIDGKSAAEALGDALKNVANKLLDVGLDKLISGTGATGGIASLLGFADGGVFVPGMGKQPLKRFAGGGVSNQAAIFGEAGPEAAIPLKGGKVPVDLRMPVAAPSSGNQNITIAPQIILQNGTPQGVQAAKTDLMPDLEKRMRAIVVDTLTRSSAARKVVRGT